MEYYLKCKEIRTAIRRAKAMLVLKAKKHGLYENFGEKEVREIENKFIDISDYSNKMNDNRNALRNFDYWCMDCDINDIKLYYKGGE